MQRLLQAGEEGKTTLDGPLYQDMHFEWTSTCRCRADAVIYPTFSGGFGLLCAPDRNQTHLDKQTNARHIYLHCRRLGSTRIKRVYPYIHTSHPRVVETILQLECLHLHSVKVVENYCKNERFF